MATGRSPTTPGAHAPPVGMVVIAASLGGLHALSTVLAGLPPDFAAAVVVVQHRQASSSTSLAEILRGRTPLNVEAARDGERLRGGVIYIAPPDLHITVDADWVLSLDDGPRVSYVRPSASLLFASAASAFGSRVVGVVLTGRGDDGADGVRAIELAGGRVVVEDPATAEADGMPRAALATGCVARVVGLPEVAGAVLSLVEEMAKQHDA